MDFRLGHRRDRSRLRIRGLACHGPHHARAESVVRRPCLTIGGSTTLTGGGVGRVPGNHDDDKLEELLQTLIVLQMFALGGSQEKIAKVVGRQKLWVNSILKGLARPKPAQGPSK